MGPLRDTCLSSEPKAWSGLENLLGEVSVGGWWWAGVRLGPGGVPLAGRLDVTDRRVQVLLSVGRRPAAPHPGSAEARHRAPGGLQQEPAQPA